MKWNDTANVCGAEQATTQPDTVKPIAAEEFYVVQNPNTKKCKISNKKDDGQHVLIGTTSYSTAEKRRQLDGKRLNAKTQKRNKIAPPPWIRGWYSFCQTQYGHNFNPNTGY